MEREDQFLLLQAFLKHFQSNKFLLHTIKKLKLLRGTTHVGQCFTNIGINCFPHGGEQQFTDLNFIGDY